MCLSLPGKIIAIHGDKATVDYNGEQRVAGTSFLPDVKVGEYVIVSAKMVLQRVSEEDARKTLALWDETDKVDSHE